VAFWKGGRQKKKVKEGFEPSPERGCRFEENSRKYRFRNAWDHEFKGWVVGCHLERVEGKKGENAVVGDVESNMRGLDFW